MFLGFFFMNLFIVSRLIDQNLLGNINQTGELLFSDKDVQEMNNIIGTVHSFEMERTFLFLFAFYLLKNSRRSIRCCQILNMFSL